MPEYQKPSAIYGLAALHDITCYTGNFVQRADQSQGQKSVSPSKTIEKLVRKHNATQTKRWTSILLGRAQKRLTVAKTISWPNDVEGGEAYIWLSLGWSSKCCKAKCGFIERGRGTSIPPQVLRPQFRGPVYFFVIFTHFTSFFKISLFLQPCFTWYIFQYLWQKSS